MNYVATALGLCSLFLGILLFQAKKKIDNLEAENLKLVSAEQDVGAAFDNPITSTESLSEIIKQNDAILRNMFNLFVRPNLSVSDELTIIPLPVGSFDEVEEAEGELGKSLVMQKLLISTLYRDLKRLKDHLGGLELPPISPTTPPQIPEFQLPDIQPPNIQLPDLQ